MALTKEQLEKLLEEAKEDQPIELMTPDEHQEKLDSAMKRRLAKEKEKQDKAFSRIAQLEAELKEQLAKIQDIEDNAERKGKSESEHLQMDLEKLRKAQEVWAKEKEQLHENMKDLQKKRAGKYKRDLLQTLLLEKGEVAQDKLTDALDLAELRIGAYFQVEESNGDFSYKVTHPETLEAVDAEQLVKGFIDQRPSYKRAKPSGGGLPSAGPQPPPPAKDIFDGVPAGPKQIQAAWKAGHRLKTAGEKEGESGK